jgi:hypothetical protein
MGVVEGISGSAILFINSLNSLGRIYYIYRLREVCVVFAL